MKHLLLTTIAAVVLVGCESISIHQAVFDGNIEAVKQHLAAGTDVNAKDEDDETPLGYAEQVSEDDLPEEKASMKETANLIRKPILFGRVKLN